MTALVVYESMFGSTKTVAEAIAEGLRASGPVRIVEVSTLASSPGSTRLADDITLLVVGAPTHAFSLSRANTRQDAAAQAPGGVISSGKGVREWLEALSLPTGGLPVACFDTKVAKPNLPGSAAKSAEKRLKGMGGRPVVAARSFKVHGKADGLLEGEADAALAWGRALGGMRARL
ncbi:MAG TPA: flavodoxin domain-containing protein [Actinotalea sp.]|jgi:hypothetical protein